MASATGIWCAAMRRRRASGSSGRSPRGDGRRSGSSCRKWSCADDDPHRNGQESSGARGVAGRLHEPRAQEIPMKRVGLFALLMTLPLALYAQAPRSLSLNDQRARDIFEQLININTTGSSGSTTVAASAMAKRLSDAGFPAADVQVIGLEGSKNGNLVARFRGTGREKPILLLAHLDVVEATGEEGGSDYNGVEWLLAHHRDLIDAAYVLNMDAGDPVILNGKRLMRPVQASEKVYVTFKLEVHNSGGHSSLPTKDNAIYRLAAALGRLSAYEFPAQLNEITRTFFQRMAGLQQGQLAADMAAVAAPTLDPAAIRRLSNVSPLYNAQLRTTCVATELSGGHAENALPQTATAA